MAPLFIPGMCIRHWEIIWELGTMYLRKYFLSITRKTSIFSLKSYYALNTRWSLFSYISPPLVLSSSLWICQKPRMNSTNILYKRHRFPPEAIQHIVWLCFEIATQFVYERFRPACSAALGLDTGLLCYSLISSLFGGVLLRLGKRLWHYRSGLTTICVDFGS